MPKIITLTDEQQQHIIALKGNLSIRNIARQFRISPTKVQSLLRGEERMTAKKTHLKSNLFFDADHYSKTVSTI